MTPLFRCPWCREVGDTADRFLNHLFAWHQRLIRERLAITRSPRPRKTLDPPRNAAKPAHGYSPGVSGEGDT